MPARITVSKVTDADWRLEADLDASVITIGRHSSNAVRLEDPKKIVSRKHAEVIREEGGYSLVDCQSANSTFVNDEKLVADHPYQLQNGDLIKIGDYLLTYYAPEDTTEADDISENRTVLYQNPFLSDARALFDWLAELQEKYAKENENIRKDALREALVAALADTADSSGEILSILQKSCPEDLEQPAASAPASNTRTAPVRDDLNTVADVIIDGLIQTAKADAKFRKEFMDIATVFSEHPLYLSSPEEFREYLFSPDITREEYERRLENIKLQIEEHLLHEKATLKGYRALIDSGAQQLLTFLDPDNLEKFYSRQQFELGSLKIPMGIIPFYAKIRAFRDYKKMIRQMAEDGKVGFDRKIFRPSFVKSYMETLAGNSHLPPAPETMEESEVF